MNLNKKLETCVINNISGNTKTPLYLFSKSIDSMVKNNVLFIDKIINPLLFYYLKLKKKKRNFSSILPNLLGIQQIGFQKFLQTGISLAIKKTKPLVFQHRNQSLELFYFSNHLIFTESNLKVSELLKQNNTHGCFVFLPVLLKLKKQNQIYTKLDWLEIGFLPFLLKSGHFFINGIPRVILNQLIRAPGVYKLFNKVETTKGIQTLPYLQIIPDEGSWVTISFDAEKRLWITTKILKTKVSFLIFLQALGIDINFLFENINYSEILLSSIIPPLNKTVGENLTKNDNILKKANLTHHPLNQIDACKYIYAHYLEYNNTAKKIQRKLSAKQQQIFAKEACLFFNQIVWNSQNKYLGKNCRNQFVYKLGMLSYLNRMEITNDDFIKLTQTIINLFYGEDFFDDIDNLNNKQIRGCEDFLCEELMSGLHGFESFLKINFEKFAVLKNKKKGTDFETFWKNQKSFLPNKITKSWRNFFLSGTFSQLLDETNPLAEMTHKRRLTLLGLGGVDNQQATISVRGIHPTYYGRICPIETPEGQNAGLVHSFTVFSYRASNGIIRSPYFKVYKGQIQKNLSFIYLSSLNEISNEHALVSADIRVSRWNRFPNINIPIRQNLNFDYINFNQITAQSVSVLQMISLAASFIPFLEHNDANRTLMGSNMQRQAVPVLKAEVALVKTNLEGRLILDITHVIEAPTSGFIIQVNSNIIKLYKPKNFVNYGLFLKYFNKYIIKKNIKYNTIFIYNNIRFSLIKNLLKYFIFTNFYINSGSLRIQNKIFHKKPEFCYFKKKLKFQNYQTISSDLYKRTIQSTCIIQRPIISEMNWVENSAVLVDGGASLKGNFAVGKNVLIAYLPWEGYNFEDAILISENLVSKDIFTSLHLDYYIAEVQETATGLEFITNQLPLDVDSDIEKLLKLDSRGIIKKGTWVKEGDFLVGKTNMDPISNVSRSFEKLRNAVFQPNKLPGKNTSFIVPKGIEGLVVDIEIITHTDERIISLAPRNAILSVKVSLLQRRKIQVGDKIAGRHGNKGVISKILPIQDMPYLPDGTPIDIILNPLGIPSRMNVGQIMECLLGLAGKYLNESYIVNLFDEKFGIQASRSYVYSKLYQASLKTKNSWLFEPQHPGKIKIFDGRTGKAFQQPVTVGYTYMLKLLHMVDDKIHARATGPYSVITQQPVGGRANNGGQRVGEMEVWALQAYGAAFTLQELLTLKSDDRVGRVDVTLAIAINKPIAIKHPESLKLLLREIQALCINLEMYNPSSSTLKKYSLIDRKDLDNNLI